MFVDLYLGGDAGDRVVGSDPETMFVDMNGEGFEVGP